MPEYVYALHDFAPEHDDEIDFKAGDRIEVIEKDDLYGDGWWQGRNLVGKVGLFPQSYTSGTAASPVPVPEIRTPKLQPLQEESAEDIAALTPEPKPASLLADGSPSPNNNGNAVMSATLTDVQRAIEQLAARRDTDDTSRSFSFVSTNHDTESESEADREDDGQHQWHKDARKALAERAQVENAKKKKEEEEALRVPPPPTLLEVPSIPIAAEVSDESDMEDDDNDDNDEHPPHHKPDKAETATITHTDVTVVPQPLPPLLAPIPEPAQPETTPILATLTASTTSRSSPVDDAVSSSATSVSPSASLSVAVDIPLPKSPAVSTPNHTRITTPQLVQNLNTQPPYPESHLSPLSTSTPVGTAVPKVLETPLSAATITPFNSGPVVRDNKETSATAPPTMTQAIPSSPSPSSLQVPAQVEVQLPPFSSTPYFIPNNSQLPRPVSPPTQLSRAPSPSPVKPIHPSEWGVDQVVEWLKGKGMDEATCAKFIEHEITGDVLLELDAAMLKDEMGIVALGKRMRIQNGIIELKRPVSANIGSMASSISGASPSLMPGANTAINASPLTGLPIQQQQIYNFNGIPVPGASLGYANAHIVTSPAPSSSFNSGYGYAYNGGGGSGKAPSIESPMTMPGNASPYAGSMVSEEFGNGVARDGGLQPSAPKPRPAHLKFSPSDGILSGAGGAAGFSPTREDSGVADKDEDKGVQSETDISHSAISTRRRRLFGLSTESGASSGSRKSGDSKEKDKTSVPTTPRSGSIRIARSNSNVLSTGITALRSRSPTPVGARRSGESANQAADDSLVVVSAASSPALGGKHAKNKKSFDGGLASVFGKDKLSVEKEKEKSGDRLSFFGTSMSLGKGRKAPPRYSVYEADTMAQTPSTTVSERHRSISRYITSSMGLSSSGPGGKKNGRPGTAPSGKNVPFGSSELNASPTSPTSKLGTVTFATSKDDTHIASSPSSTVLRKRHLSTSGPVSPSLNSTSKKGAKDGGTVNARSSTPGKAGKVDFQAGLSVLDQIGQPDHAGWLRKKGEKYNAWKTRYLVLKGPHLYYMKNADRTATKIKGYVKVQGYKIISDDSGPGKYGFKIVHEAEPAHYFSSDELLLTREWMKALMKATIERDYSKPVISSCNIPTIPLVVAQTMNPAPRPPSPTARDATQRALRRENPNQLSSRDARVLMGLPDSANEGKSNGNGRAAADTFFMEKPLTPPPLADEDATLVGLASSVATSKAAGNGVGSGMPPKRPSRDARSSSASIVNPKSNAGSGPAPVDNASEAELVDWANSLLPPQYKIHDVSKDLTSGLVFLRLAESIRGRPSEPPIPDSLFTGENNLDGMFKLFDFLLLNEIKMGSVSINDIKHGRWDKTVQLLKALKTWGEKRKSIARAIGKPSNQAGPWMAVEPGTINW